MAELYLYNGIELPKIPEKDGYPYCWFTKLVESRKQTGYALWLASNKITTVWSTLYKRYMVDYEGNSQLYYYRFDEPEWVFIESRTWYLSDAFVITPLWLNHDVIAPDGTVLHTASTPVPVIPIDYKVMLQGWIVGKRLAAMRVKREPVAYLYNGVRLPKLPEWDAVAYPYACIYQVYGEYVLACMNVQCAYRTSTIGTGYVTIPHRKWCTFSYRGGVWEAQAVDVEINDYTSVNSELYWANYDVSTTGGTLYLAASDPVPVYE